MSWGKFNEENEFIADKLFIEGDRYIEYLSLLNEGDIVEGRLTPQTHYETTNSNNKDKPSEVQGDIVIGIHNRSDIPIVPH